MTAPRNCFGAHDRGWLELREAKKIVERLTELSRLHVVGVSAEARISPQRVVRIASSPAAPTERWQMRVPAARIDDRPLQARLREMRVSRRSGKGAHIDQMCRAFPREQSNKLVERSGRMPDREKLSGVHAPRSSHLLPAVTPRAV